MGLIAIPENSCVKVLTPSTSERDCICRQPLKRWLSYSEVIRRVLIQYDWSFKKRSQMHMRKDHEKTQGENGHLQAKERGLGRDQTSTL